jgi:uncharacterized protein with HEPN domain
MQGEDRVRLTHMIEAAEKAMRFAAGRERSDLETDEMLSLAMTRAVEIIGEAASRISEAGRADNPEIPWRVIVAMRNRLVHAYFDINRDVLWRTVAEEIPAILPVFRAALDRE